MKTEVEGTTLDTILADFFQLDLIAVQNSWGDGAGIFKLKQQLAAYLEAQTRAAKQKLMQHMIDDVTTELRCEKDYVNNAFNIQYYQNILDYLENRQKLYGLAATTLQETPQGASDGLSEPAQPKDSKPITGETK
jgi:hypothetical protein